MFDTSAPAAQQITPYIDGEAITYTKLDSGTGAGPFANSTLYVMSRACQALFGNGDLDELALYNRALSASTIAEHADSYGTNRRPIASFTATPNPAKPGQTVTFNGSGSSDPDGTLTKYEWDLDGNGSYETNTGTTPTATRSYATEGTVDVRLRVTDNQTGTDVETKTVTVVSNQAPTASFTASPNPAVLGQTTNFNASASADPDGTIARYEWDLDGNGSYETDTGTTATTSRSYTATGTTTVGLRVTDNSGTSATKTVPVVVNANGVSNYGDTVLDTDGLVNYWRLGESSGTTLADSRGTSPASAQGGVTLGVPGGPAGDPNTAARFDGANDCSSANVNLSHTNRATVEFWLRWNAFAGDDRLAMEFTPNFNNNAGGFLIDPNAPQQGGSFGVGIDTDAGRNNVFFSRPSAAQWHHYAFVFDRTQPAAQQITPYVDGQAVTYSKLDNGAGTGNFANSTLYFMSRACSALFGGGDLDDVAIYDRALSAGTVAEHYGSYGTNRRPVATFTVSPSAPKPNQTVTYNASASSDPDGSIVRYEWDLDGNGSYETNTGTNPQATTTYATAQNIDVHLRVYDNSNGTDVATRAVSIGNAAPTAAFSISNNPAVVGSTVTFNGSGSSDADGTIAKYEWDLDGNGSYETDTGTTATASRSYASAGDVTVGLRVTDDDAATATTTRALSVVPAQQPPTASFTASPNPVQSGQTVSFNGSGSNDPDGAIAKYEWDLDGNGSYETDTGTTATTTRAYTSPGTVAVGLRVTDADGMTGTRTVPVYVNGTGTTYSQKVLATGGLSNYWRMGDGPGSTLADAKGSSTATLAGGPALGAPGAVAGDNDTAVSFDGVDDSAAANVNLSDTSKLTVEFWLKWNAFANDDDLALEFTPDYNDTPGGFLVDPNAPQGGGLFGLGLGQGASRNTAFFARPSAGQWHHYALVFDSSAPAGQQIAPYVDGQAVSFTKSASGTGAGPFANSRLFFMSRGGTGLSPAGTTLFGAGAMDELAIYKRVLSASEIADQYQSTLNNAPSASFTASPNPATPGQTVSFNGSGSTDSDGTIAKYEWDLDGNGTLRDRHRHHGDHHALYAAAGNVTVGLRVTDNKGATNTTTRSVVGQPGADRLLHGHAEPGPECADGGLQRLGARPTPTARSPSTSGTSTATAATRPTPARPRLRPGPTPRRARSRSACASPTTTARRRRPRAR